MCGSSNVSLSGCASGDEGGEGEGGGGWGGGGDGGEKGCNPRTAGTNVGGVPPFIIALLSV